MFESILVVCTGNICRSPIGERYMRSVLPNKKIDSAGTGALIDHEADAQAKKLQNERVITRRASGPTINTCDGTTIRSYISDGKDTSGTNWSYCS